MTQAYYFDGDSPLAQPATVQRSEGDMLQIALDNGGEVLWPARKVRRLDDHPTGQDDIVLRVTSDPVARLYVPKAKELPPLLKLTKRAPPKGRGRLAAWALAAVGAVALQIFVLIPLMADQLANIIPQRAERALGDATFEQIRSALGNDNLGPLRVCEQGEGLAALNTMADKFSGAMPEGTAISTYVLNHPMINAFALPGGNIVFFRGLIDAAETPEEVAAVFAHELGHVVSRDPTRHALRSAGSIGVLGLLFGDFAGGAVVLFLAERLIDANYSQTAEAEADVFAHKALDQVNVSPAALGDMFERLRDRYGDNEGIVSHFLSHPTLSDRIKDARQAAPDSHDRTPILSDADWAALQNICET